MVLDWMLLFFKQLTTNQYMDQQELYQQNWCSIVGGVLDWMLFFSKCWQLVSTWISENQIWKGSQSGSGVPLWEGFLIGCSSVSNICQLVSTWMMDSIILKITQSRSGIPLWERLLIGYSSVSNINTSVLSQKWHKAEVAFHCGRCSWLDVILFQMSVN